jgi:DNA-binding GntR family transcriptional regulator
MTSLRLPEVGARVSLREQVTAALRTALISGQLQPGITYSIPTLAEQLGVSATPVREAMLDFVQQGILVAVPNKGFRVVELSDADLDALTEVRRMLEVPAVERASGTFTPEALGELRERAEQVREAAARGDLVGYLEGDREFHRALLAGAGNPRLVDIVDSLRTQSRLYALGELAADGTLVASAEEHLDLLEAVQRGDAAAAADLMGHHLDHVRGSWAKL